MTLSYENGQEWHSEQYEWKSGSVNVAGADPTTNITGSAAFTNLFATVKRAHHITIESTGTLYVRLNGTTTDIITVTATAPFSSDYLAIKSIYVASGGAAVTVTVKLA
jgi:hypothetical protein